MRTPVTAQVEKRGGRATLVVNGQPMAPLIYALTDCPGARWTWEEVPTRNIALFAQHGFRLFQADMWLEWLLQPDGSLDLSLARRQIRGVLDACPDAFVMLRFHLNATPEWCTANPDECVQYADGPAEPEERWGLERWLGRDNDGPVRASFYSEKWRGWARTGLARFCRELAATPEGAAVFSLQLAYGVYGEWHQFGFFSHDPDTSPAAEAAFRRWLANRYGSAEALARAWRRPGLNWADVKAPDTPSREAGDVAMVRDPAGRRPVIDYYTFLHEGLADTVIMMAQTVREAWPRPIATAAFFGYFYCQFGRETAGGHLAVGRVLASPHLDLVCATPAYTPTALPLGGAGNSRGIVDAVRRAGKVWLDEMDRATSVCGCPWDKTFTGNIPDDIAVLRRNLLQPVTRGGGAWGFDFGPISGTPAFARLGNIGWWDHPQLQREWRAVRELAQGLHSRPYRRPSDVLLLHDPWAFAHMASARHDPTKLTFGIMPISPVDPLSRLLTDGVVEALHQSGLIHTDALLSELEQLDLAPFRLVILATTVVLTPAQREYLRTRVAASGRHLVLLGFAGWSDGTQLGAATASGWNGFAYELHLPPVGTQILALDGRSETQTLPLRIPVPAVSGGSAEIVGRWEDGAASAACRRDADATWWTFAVPPVQPATWRAVGRRAGCCVINDQDETTLVGDGLLVIHTVTGGERSLQLPGGPQVKVNLLPRSTTVLDVASGAVLLDGRPA